MPGRIRIEVEGELVDERPWFSKQYLKNIINNAQELENVQITITADEQPACRRNVVVGRRGCSNIIFPGADQDDDEVRRSA
jgi:hypothetical protein